MTLRLPRLLAALLVAATLAVALTATDRPLAQVVDDVVPDVPAADALPATEPAQAVSVVPAEDICEWYRAVLGFQSPPWFVTGYRHYVSGYGGATWCEVRNLFYGIPAYRCYSVSFYGPVTLFPQQGPDGTSGCRFWSPFG
jgi:hypothetical protein